MPAENRQTTEPTTVAQEATRSLHRSHGSFELALAPVILALLGLWLDRTIGTVPLFAILFAVLGIVGAFAKVYFEYRHLMAEHDQQGPWVGHTRSTEFRHNAAARAERLSVPLEERP